MTDAQIDAAPVPGTWSTRQLICHLADFEPYVAAQRLAARDFRDRHGWARRAALNVARIGYFSSDRAVREYARETWDIHPVV